MAVQNRQAAGLILAGMMSLGLSDNLLQFITEDGSLWQYHFVRGALVLVMLAGLSAFGLAAMRPKNLRLVMARSMFPASAMLIYFGCLATLPIGVVVAGLFTSPLFVVLISTVFQKKQITWVQVAAVCVGFAGALLVIQPDPSDLNPVMFLPIFAGFLYAIGAVATRAWCEGESSFALTGGFFVLLTLFGAVGSLVLAPDAAQGAEGFPLRGWVPLTGANLFWTAAQGVLSLFGILFIFRGYLVGEAGIVVIFEYSLLIFASIWAFILWGDAVSPLGLLGMAMIMLAGTVIGLRKA